MSAKDSALIYDKKSKKWVKPPMPEVTAQSGEYTWVKDKGWTSQQQLAGRVGGDGAETWAFALQAINDNTDLKNVFDKAWTAEKSGTAWSSEKFVNEIKKTDWYSKHSSSWRAYYLKSEDPSQAGNLAKDIETRSTRIRDFAHIQGATLTDDQVKQLAVNTLQTGTNDERDINNAVSGYIKYQTLTQEDLTNNFTSSLTGQAGQVETSVRDWAKQYGVTISDDFIQSQAQNVASGGNINDAKNFIVNLAKKTYTPWADSITSAQSTLDAGAHYRNSISNMLGTPIESIDMSNKWMKSFMSNKTDKGEVLTLQDAEKSIRHSDEWATSTPGREEINRSTNQILSKMGLA